MWRLREIELNFVFREWEPYNGTAPPRAKGGKRKCRINIWFMRHLTFAA